MTASKIQMDQIRSTSATVTDENIRAGSQKKSSLSPAEGLQGASPDATCTCPSGDGSLRWPCPKHPAVEHERAEFEAWVRRDWPGAPLRFIRDALPVDDPRYGQYCDDALQRAWVGWQARAALAQPSPAQAEQAEAERPIVSFEKYMQVMYDRDENAKRLDAALARVAELEKQEPVATIAKVPGEDWNGLHFYRDLQGMQPGTTLYAAPVAQAQHSVPEEFIGRLSEFLAQRGATGKALLRELRDMLAAAHGKEVGHE
ncbi:hypothetical protein FA137_04080 [Pseudomonas aeruginosa]|uniref:hypothetical protein n=1 Tax=Pseudomonas aeruginosa TaxID=287 RepID=UPI00071C0102|nr:hypothetical protein [Pseudomonas aeruginosa]KSH03788.1 hypothetical protein AO968_07950 [Pseudomonas aeruginosa]MCO3702742.1 hypothetical protein [Pseudomonas aeruginosa]RAL83080.1 hypothetical protein CSC34_5103 [Pseudomonas aeruginosa]HCL3698853.1 hypothetical protein [Pseudomonas aeruginosa]